jgi:DNA mismatch endonuclease (patch repair protein)
MSLVRSKGNLTTEAKLAKMLRNAGVAGWRRHANLCGKPDFTFPKRRLCIFVDGCFWHGCPKHYKPPNQNAAFWSKKLRYNQSNDRRVNVELRERGYRVIRLWECQLKNAPRVIRRIEAALTK